MGLGVAQLAQILLHVHIALDHQIFVHKNLDAPQNVLHHVGIDPLLVEKRQHQRRLAQLQERHQVRHRHPAAIQRTGRDGHQGRVKRHVVSVHQRLVQQGRKGPDAQVLLAPRKVLCKHVNHVLVCPA